eukprot:1120103-Prorocentrum_minimum.AAC.4
MSLVLCTESEAGNGLAVEICLEVLLERGSGEISIGRHPTNDIVFSSSRLPLLLSRFHAYIGKNAHGFYCGDKNTTNGTYVSRSSYVHLPFPSSAAPCILRSLARMQCRLTVVSPCETCRLTTKSFGHRSAHS